MSYDLYAWREEADLGLSPEQIVERFENEAQIPGIACVPVGEITAAFRGLFPDIKDGNTELNWEGAGSYFQVCFCYASFRVVSFLAISCGFELLKSRETFEKVVEVCRSLRYKVFDPQRGEYL